MEQDFSEVLFIRMSKELRKTLEQQARDRMTTMSAVAREAIVRGLGVLVDTRERYDTSERDYEHG